MMNPANIVCLVICKQISCPALTQTQIKICFGFPVVFFKYCMKLVVILTCSFI